MHSRCVKKFTYKLMKLLIDKRREEGDDDDGVRTLGIWDETGGLNGTKYVFKFFVD